MIGARVGVKVGPRVGSAVGVSADPISAAVASDPMAGVTRDAASGKYFPASAAEWTTTMAAAGIASGNPSALWLCQEASGNLADSIGAFTLTAAGTPTYQQAVAGYTRLGIAFDNGSTDGFSTASLSLPDLLTDSQLVLACMRLPAAAPAASRGLIAIGGAGTRASINITSTPRIEGRHVANIATGAASPCDGAVHPVVCRSSRTGGTEADMLTEAEKVSPAFGATVAGRGILLGNGAFGAADSALLYAVSFHGVAGGLTDAQIKTLLQTLGWTVLW